MRLFWRNGYERTSTSELVDNLGIARASLYGAFGSKRDLYLAALDRFLAENAGLRPPEASASPRSALDSIRTFLEASATTPQHDTPGGCFAINATVEHGDTDAEISRRLEGNRNRLETALHYVLMMAHANGELAPSVDPRAGATMLAALNTGLKVLARAGTDQRSRIETTIDAVMSMLTAPRAGAPHLERVEASLKVA